MSFHSDAWHIAAEGRLLLSSALHPRRFLTSCLITSPQPGSAVCNSRYSLTLCRGVICCYLILIPVYSERQSNGDSKQTLRCGVCLPPRGPCSRVSLGKWVSSVSCCACLRPSFPTGRCTLPTVCTSSWNRCSGSAHGHGVANSLSSLLLIYGEVGSRRFLPWEADHVSPRCHSGVVPNLSLCCGVRETTLDPGAGC